MRLFLAVDVPEDVRQRISYMQERLAEIPGVNIVKPDHVTLKFIGETAQKFSDIAEKLAHILDDFYPFAAEAVGMGTFPATHPKVVWVGCPALAPLQKAIMEGFGDSAEATPHITVARVKDGRGKEHLVKHVNQMKEYSYGRIDIDNIKIKSSVLTTTGPTYSDVATVQLNFTKSS